MDCMSAHRGWGQDSIFFEHLGDAPCRDGERHRRCVGRWVALVSLGFGPNGKRLRRKVTGSTKAAVQDRLKKLHEELDSGVRTTPNYTVRRAAEDWLADGLDGRSAKTIKKNENVLAPILASTVAQGRARAGQLVLSSRRWKNWIVACTAAGLIPTAVFGSTASSPSGRVR